MKKTTLEKIKTFDQFKILDSNNTFHRAEKDRDKNGKICVFIFGKNVYRQMNKKQIIYIFF